MGPLHYDQVTQEFAILIASLLTAHIDQTRPESPCGKEPILDQIMGPILRFTSLTIRPSAYRLVTRPRRDKVAPVKIGSGKRPALLDQAPSDSSLMRQPLWTRPQGTGVSDCLRQSG